MSRPGTLPAGRTLVRQPAQFRRTLRRWLARYGPWEGRTGAVGGQLLYVVAYLLAAVWAREFGIGGSILIWFPPAGVAIAAVTLVGVRMLPAVLLAELLSTVFVMGFGEEFGPGLLVLNTVAIGGAYVLSGEALRRSGFDPSFAGVSDLLHFVACRCRGRRSAARRGRRDLGAGARRPRARRRRAAAGRHLLRR